MDRLSGQVGSLLLNEDGAVLSSSGELENDEKCADIIMGLLSLTSTLDPVAFPGEERFKKLSVTYEDHCYIVCLSNRKIHIVKKNLSLASDVMKYMQICILLGGICYSLYQLYILLEDTL